MAAEMGSGSGWGQSLDDEGGVWGWLRLHRIYSAAVLAIVVTTLYGAHWAGQPSGEMETMSTPSSVSVPALLPAVD